jgi:hypothetical protein
MQYLVGGRRGPLPASPEQALALLEDRAIPAGSGAAHQRRR